MILKIDQEFKNLIPPLTHEDRTGLENNIKANGCEIPITVWNGTIIDGHNRYEICIANDIPFETKEISFADRVDAKIWIIRHELEWKGRKITSAIRLDLTDTLKNLFAEKAKKNHAETHTKQYKENVKESTWTPLQKIEEVQKIKDVLNTREEIAKIAQVGIGTVARYGVIKKQGDAKLLADVRSGEKSINEAYIEAKKQEIQKQEEEARKQHKIEKEKEQDIKEPENRINPEWKELEKKCINGSCTYNPASVLDVLSMCPCGCGFGFYSNLRTEKDKWYSKDEITKLKEMK